MLRLYLFDTSGEVPSGLSHQMSNLRAILVEGLSLGRGILLLPPSLTIKHNFDKQFRYNMWSDFIDLNRSHLTLSRTVPDVSNRQKLQRTLCAVRMADCIAEISEHQLRHLQYDSHTLIPYHNGSISPEINTRHGLLVRGPEPDSLDKVALVRKLPGFPELLSIPITIQFGNTASQKKAISPVLSWLHMHTLTGEIAIVHVRRGDKITNKKYCPKEMRMATSPDHIAKVLKRVGLTGGSAIYVMTDETDFNHFNSLITEYNYTLATNAHFFHLHNLIAGCQQSTLKQQTHGDESMGALCENYLLFAIEKEIMLSVPKKYRIVTLPRRDFEHNQNYLMQDFLGRGKPCSL
eukprot:CAMPEP_0197295734 /NCGR_PEP_ID=MMETSP0890-20130614/36395_1 /TAXON_ID=44058 ORGANISM="Aureoumbra lagunensis, Strain CCMP1510" /NCGR_SAMPLE_ID=MMETSP0890 /ASSEMBLY_ACC=CAM_ASM_000533 /LENGTH=348 /DNA_ID=CAMNT_0042771885 /DNA_START=405 /DNA_END=1452 /DNA_ORIENTATION=-